MPEVLDWHMIFDHELDQLSRRETGVIGSLGFVALGAAIGLTPDLIESWQTVKLATMAYSQSEFISALLCVGSWAAAVICLSLFGVSRWRNRGLTTRIRNRKRYDLPWGGGNASTEKPAPSA